MHMDSVFISVVRFTSIWRLFSVCYIRIFLSNMGYCMVTAELLVGIDVDQEDDSAYFTATSGKSTANAVGKSKKNKRASMVSAYYFSDMSHNVVICICMYLALV